MERVLAFDRYLRGLWRDLITPMCPAPSTSAGPSPGARLTVGLSGTTHLTASLMTTDHQVTEQDQSAGAESGLGVIVAGLIVLATLATVVLLVAH